MPKKLDTFEFPHGGRKGLDYDFDPYLDGESWEFERGVDFDMSMKAETFLGALSRAANAKNLRVNKSISDDGNLVRIRARPKKEKKEKVETPATDTPAPSRGRNRRTTAAK